MLMPGERRDFMNGKYLIGAVIESVIKVVVIAVVVMFVFRMSTAAYDFGYRVFADEPVSLTGGRTITVGIAESAGVKDIALMLEEKGLIEDAKLFVVQELLSAYHGEILPGIYDLSTNMTAEEMLAIMSTPVAETETPVTEEVENSGESETGENTEGMTTE